MKYLLWLTLPLFSLLLLDSCSYTERIRDGETAYERMQYAIAKDLLGKEFNKSKSTVEKGKKAYLIGSSLMEMHDYAAAKDWFKQAYDLQYGPKALREYAYALKLNEEYALAATTFEQVGREMGNPYQFGKEAEACQTVADWFKEELPPAYQVESLGFNGPSSDFAPSLFKENKLVFSSDRTDSEGEKPYNWYGKDFTDLFVADLESNTVQPFEEGINSEYNEGTASFTEDGSRIYFTRCGKDGKTDVDFCKIMTAIKKRDGGWSKPRILSFVEGEVNYRHPQVSGDGTMLYFSSDEPRGFGGYDLYRTQKTDDGWSQPENLGSRVNTDKNELFPFVQEDTLYFSSDGHLNMGGLDIFKATWDGRKWRMVENLKPPVNSGGDDFAFVLATNRFDGDTLIQEGYFSSLRKNGKGGDDLYRFSRLVPPPPVEEDTVPEQIVFLHQLEGTVLENLYLDPTNPNSRITGQQPLPDANVDISFNGEKIQVKTDENGKFFLEVQSETAYQFLASKPEYLNNTNALNTEADDPTEPVKSYEVTIILSPLFRNVDINLPNIYYDFNEAFIRADAEPTLNDLVALINNNPQIKKIQLSSHTDCRGTNALNEDLSQRRAQSAVDYLVSKGIDEDMLQAKGYGEYEPAVDCVCQRCTEEEHQANRRTAFRIIE